MVRRRFYTGQYVTNVFLYVLVVVSILRKIIVHTFWSDVWISEKESGLRCIFRMMRMNKCVI